MTQEWVTIAILGKPRGNRGELTAISLSDHPERFEALTQVFLYNPSTEQSPAPYATEEVWHHQATLIFKFTGVNSIDDAQQLTGWEVRIPFSERLPLEAHEFYHSDLIGCEVRDRATGRSFGHVTGFEEGGANGLLKIGQQILIPFTREICVTITPEKQLILVDLPEGLIELNQ
jgi:16S rRNA processing protein RimM